MKPEVKTLLKRQGYGLIGNHSAVKICSWTKKALTDKGFCYKQKFYGIRSHMCCQMTPALDYCSNECIFCWRDMQFFNLIMKENIDTPEKIIEGSITEQRRLLNGFGGNSQINKEKYEESQNPMHFAISLTGEPTVYPKLKELIDELHKKGNSTFVVTNGMFPDQLKKINPTQLYVSVTAPNEKLYLEIDKPRVDDAWNKLKDSLKILSKHPRGTIRITLIKGINMIEPEGYSDLIKLADAKFVEVKAYMYVGSSRERLVLENMPRHNEVAEFASEIGKHCGYKIIDEQKESRVVLLMKEDRKDRIMKF